MEEADDQYSLKWNNYQANLATGFMDLLQDEDMLDVTLAAGGKYLQAHKVILSVCSGYFRDLFKLNPCKHPIVILKDVGHQEMSDMLSFMYRGEASVRQEDMASFLKLADTLQVKGLANGLSKSKLQEMGIEKPAPAQQQQQQQQPVMIKKKKRAIEPTVFEPDDPGEMPRPATPPPPAQTHSKPKRIRTTSPVAERETQIKHEEEETTTIEFLEESEVDPLESYMTRDKSVTASEYGDVQGDSMTAVEIGEEEITVEELSGMDSMVSETDVPPGKKKVCYLPRSTSIVAVPVPSATTPARRAPPSPVWNYFLRDHNRRIAVCLVCKTEFRVHSGTTSGLFYHLRTAHPDHNAQLKADLKEWEQHKDFVVYQNYMRDAVKKKRSKTQFIRVMQVSSGDGSVYSEDELRQVEQVVRRESARGEGTA